MADNENNMSQQPQLCKQGCGFYGNANFDGMCSKCYKDYVQRKANTAGVVGRMSPNTNSSDRDRASSLSAAFASAVSGSAPTGITVGEMHSLINEARAENARMHSASVSIDMGANANVDGAADLTGKASEPSPSGSLPQLTANANGAQTATGPGSTQKMSNRCDTCKKKVGLTGFGCRCGGTFCGEHRYSDRHACQFDYKEHGAQQLRKLNPVVVADKVTKI